MYNIWTIKPKYREWDMDIKIVLKILQVGDMYMQMSDEQ